MNKLIPALSLVFILFGCRKAEQTDSINPKPDAPLYDVKFNVADFATTLVPMGTQAIKSTMAVTTDLKSYADYFSYRVYDSRGFVIKLIDQDNTSANFGTINDRLGSGTYSVVMVAAKNSPPSFTRETLPYEVASFSSSSNGYWNDVFHKAFKLTIEDKPVTQKVQLDRLTAAFNLVLEDAIPADVSKITVSLYDEGQLGLNGSYNSRQFTRSYDFTLAASDAGVKGKSFTGLLINTFGGVNFTVTAYNASNKAIFEKIVDGVQFNKGQRLTISGVFFTTANKKTVYTAPVGINVTAMNTQAGVIVKF